MTQQVNLLGNLAKCGKYGNGKYDADHPRALSSHSKADSASAKYPVRRIALTIRIELNAAGERQHRADFDR